MDKNSFDILTQLEDNSSIAEENKTSQKSFSKYELEREKTEVDKIKEEIESIKQDRFQRKWLAEQIFSFSSIYMFGVFIILFLVGTNNTFFLSDSVINMLLGTTTANVLGILVIVATYFFAKRKK